MSMWLIFIDSSNMKYIYILTFVLIFIKYKQYYLKAFSAKDLKFDTVEITAT